MFDHLLVTIGRSPTDCVKYGKKWTPLLLVPFPDLVTDIRKMAYTALVKRSACLLPTTLVNPVSEIAAKASDYFAKAAQDLWWFNVDILASNDFDYKALGKDYENAYLHEWVIRNDYGKYPPSWQGPAEGVTATNQTLNLFELAPEECGSKLHIIDL